MRFRRHHLGRVLAAIGLTAGSLAFTAAGPAAADVVEPFGKRYDESLYGDFTTLGNTVMGCPTAPADLAARCATAASGQGADDDTFVMRRIDAAGLAPGPAPAHGSSAGHVVVPAGAEVAYARLFRGGNDGTHTGPSGARLKRCDISGTDVVPSPGDPETTAPVIKVGAGAATPVSIDSMVVDPADTSGPHYSTGESDVTAAFAGTSGTDARISVGNLWAPEGKGCVAGWSLTVVHRLPAPDPVHAPEPADDLGIDAKAFDVPAGAVPPGAASADLTFSTKGDTYVPSAVAFSVPVPDLEITRTASPAKVRPGDTLTYTITARNVGAVDYPNARFGDDLTGNLDDADYNGDVRTDLGTVSHEKPRIGYAGTIPAGRTATVTYSVKIKNPPTGDGRLRSAVEVETPRSNCGDGSEDPACAVAPVLDRPKPTASPKPTEPSPKPTAPSPDPTEPSPDPTAPSPDPTAPQPPVESDEPSAPGPSTTVPAPPSSPAPPAHGPQAGSAGSMAETGGDGERLWLLGALAVALAATGLVAKAAMRGRRD
ncbi:hypothetical protein AB0F25_18535 [Streptomyces wedmorensis]|uniref:DUF7927 domain-containing protein n=1 Tax=Streptomyces wedmorensis TaxID=43759 RepID=UPI0034131D78